MCTRNILRVLYLGAKFSIKHDIMTKNDKKKMWMSICKLNVFMSLSCRYNKNTILLLCTCHLLKLIFFNCICTWI